jgi:hypothetical protein
VSASLPDDPKGFPGEDEELRIVKQACLDAFGPCGEEVPIELLASLKRLRVGVVGRTHLLRMGNAAARAHADDRRFTSLTARISELERKRSASGKHIADLHRKLAKLKARPAAASPPQSTGGDRP